ncbi:uncharacterized protein K452DRAFT_286994, partial [Aplosporella prunicola CBS 121167]
MRGAGFAFCCWCCAAWLLLGCCEGGVGSCSEMGEWVGWVRGEWCLGLRADGRVERVGVVCGVV